jgi:hypothetical protein
MLVSVNVLAVADTHHKDETAKPPRLAANHWIDQAPATQPDSACDLLAVGRRRRLAKGLDCALSAGLLLCSISISHSQNVQVTGLVFPSPFDQSGRHETSCVRP